VFIAALVVAGLTVIAAISWHAASWAIAQLQPPTVESCMIENMRGQPQSMQPLIAKVCALRAGKHFETIPPNTP
jgi:hypothetical protein